MYAFAYGYMDMRGYVLVWDCVDVGGRIYDVGGCLRNVYECVVDECACVCVCVCG